MNMKRGLVLSLAALALVVGNAAVNAADIDLSLNLRYTNPGDPDQGGRWFLMAKTNVAGANTGISGLSVNLTNINTAGIVFGNATAVGSGAQAYPVVTQATLGANVATAGNLPFNSTAGGVTNVVFGQDLVTTIKTIGEGTGTPGVLAVDPLRNPAWANATLLMSGTFAGGGTAANQFNRPAFSGVTTDGNVYNSAANPVVLDATISTVVRGDSVTTFGLNPDPAAGLRFGDLNRNGSISFVGDVLPAFNSIGTNPGTSKWENGDFNGNGSVSFVGDVLPAFNAIGTPASPAPIAAVPEPAAICIAGLAVLGLLAAGRRGA
jgi:hypothetical protein